MERIRRYFGQFRMTWPRVLALAVATAVYTALINQVPFLKDTSFQDIAVTPECWLLFAVFIIVNCEVWWEAALKCFAFFLVSQPLIYLIEVPFYQGGWGIFRYYGWWFIVTLLTLPGGAIAFLVKKKNWLSTAVLSVATVGLAYMGMQYLHTAVRRFPHHLLSALFCFALALFLIFVLLPEKKHRAAALAVLAAAAIASAVLAFVSFGGSITAMDLDEGEWTYRIDNEAVASVEIIEGYHVRITSQRNGSAIVDFERADGKTESYCIVVDGGSMMVDPID